MVPLPMVSYRTFIALALSKALNAFLASMVMHT